LWLCRGSFLILRSLRDQATVYPSVSRVAEASVLSKSSGLIYEKESEVSGAKPKEVEVTLSFKRTSKGWIRPLKDKVEMEGRMVSVTYMVEPSSKLWPDTEGQKWLCRVTGVTEPISGNLLVYVRLVQFP